MIKNIITEMGELNFNQNYAGMRLIKYNGYL